MIHCKHAIYGICEKFSDETVAQPCIEGPCPYYEEKSCNNCAKKDKCKSVIGFIFGTCNINYEPKK